MKESKAVYVRRCDFIPYLNKDYQFYATNIVRDGVYSPETSRYDHKTHEVGCQFDSKRENRICTCKYLTPVKRRQEVRYFGSPKQIYAYQGSRSFTNIGVGSVKALQRRKVKRIYLPETSDRGVGSSDLSSYLLQKTKQNRACGYYENKRVSSKCVGGLLECNTGCVMNEKLSPIVQTVSGSTSYRSSKLNRNIEIGSSSVVKDITNTTTQVEKASKKDVDIRTEIKVEEIIQPIIIVQDDPADMKTCSRRTPERKPVERPSSSDSLLQHVHNLETPSDEPTSHQTLEGEELMENKLEIEYRNIFAAKSKSKDSKYSSERHASDLKSTSTLKRRFEALRRGLAKRDDSKRTAVIVNKLSSQVSARSRKDVSINSDPPSLEARSYSNTKQFIPHNREKTMYNPRPSHYRRSVTNKNEIGSADWSSKAVEDDDSESQGVKGMFKLWGKKFNLEEDHYKRRCTPKTSFTTSRKGIKKKPEVPKEQAKPNSKLGDTIVDEKRERDGKKFFFFKKKTKEKPYKGKKGVTAGRCEVRDGLVIKILGGNVYDPGDIEQESEMDPDGYDEIIRKSWLKKFLMPAIDSRHSVKIRWNNKKYAPSSSTVFELMDDIYKDTSEMFRTKSHSQVTVQSSYKSHSRQQYKYVQQNIEAWMIPKTITDRPRLIPAKQLKQSQARPYRSDEETKQNIEVRISDQKWFIDKSKAFSHKIEVVLHSKNFRKMNKKESSEYLRIDIPKGFFINSSIEDNNKRTNQSSDEEVYKIVEYETESDLKKDTAACNFNIGDHKQNKIKVTVSVKESKKSVSNPLETIITKPQSRDVVIQGSNVLIPKRCDVIGVGIITQRDLNQIRKPILKIQDDFSDDESEHNILRPHTKKCEFAESYLQEYYRHWTPLGIDLYSWCVSDSQLKCCSEHSRSSYIYPGVVTKSCPNILDEFQTSAIVSSCGNQSCSQCQYKQQEPAIAKPQSNKCGWFKSSKKNGKHPDVRMLPKDSIAVTKARKLYAASMKSKWTCMDFEEPPATPSCDQAYSVSDDSRQEDKSDQNLVTTECPKLIKPCCKLLKPKPKLKGTKHVSMPDCEKMNDLLAKQLSCVEPESILNYKGGNNCSDPKHATIKEECPRPFPPPSCFKPCPPPNPPTCPPPNPPTCPSKPPSCPPTPLPCKTPSPTPCKKTPPCPATPPPKPALKTPKTPPPCPPSPPRCPPSPPPCPPSPPRCPPKPPRSPPSPPPCPPTPPSCQSPPISSPPTPTSQQSSCPPSPPRPKRPSCCSPPSKKPPCCTTPNKPPCPKKSHPSSPCQKKPLICLTSPNSGNSTPSSCPRNIRCCPPDAPCMRSVPSFTPCPHIHMVSCPPKHSPPSSPPPECCCQPSRPKKCPHSPPCSPPPKPKPCPLSPPCPPPPCPHCPLPHSHTCPHVKPCPPCPPPPCSKKPPQCPHSPPCCPPSPPPCSFCCKPKKKSSPSSPPSYCETCKKSKVKSVPICPGSPPGRPTPCIPSFCKSLECQQTSLTSISCTALHSNAPLYYSPIHPCPPTRKTESKKKQHKQTTPYTSDDNFPFPSKDQVSNQSSKTSTKQPRGKCNTDSSMLPNMSCESVVTLDKQECKPSCPNYKGSPKLPCFANMPEMQCPPPPSPPPLLAAELSKTSTKSIPSRNKSKVSGLYLKMKPAPVNKSTWESDMQDDGCISINSKEKITIRLKKETPSTEEIREGFNIKVQDEDGLTLFERKDYRLQHAGIQRRPSLVGEVYKASEVRRVTTNNSDHGLGADKEKCEEIKEARSVASIANLIEIQFKLKVTQGDKVTEIDITNDDSKDNEKHKESKQKSQEIFVVKNEPTAATNSDQNNDINIRIVIKNFKPKSGKKKSVTLNNDYNDFSKKISAKFHTVSTGYSDVFPDDHVFSVHRATVDLTTSPDNLKTIDNKISVEKITKQVHKYGGTILLGSECRCITTDSNLEDKSDDNEMKSCPSRKYSASKEIQENQDETDNTTHTELTDHKYEYNEDTDTERPIKYDTEETDTDRQADPPKYDTETDTEKQVKRKYDPRERKYESRERTYDIMSTTDTDEPDALPEIKKSLSLDMLVKSRTKDEKKTLLKQVFEKVYDSKNKNKTRIRKLRDMLKVILTSDSSDHDQTDTILPTNELATDVTYASLKPNYFRDNDSMNNYYRAESKPVLPEEIINTQVVYPTMENNSDCSNSAHSVEVLSSETESAKPGGCMCSTLAARLKLASRVGEGCCCCTTKKTSKKNEETTCDLKRQSDYHTETDCKTTEVIDVQTQNSRYLASKINSTNLSANGSIKRSVGDSLDDEVKDSGVLNVDSKQFQLRKTISPERFHLRECEMRKRNRNAILSISDEDKIVLRSGQSTQLPTGNNGVKVEKKDLLTRINASDILQSYEAKKAVLEIYAEKTISADGEHLVAKLPKFVYDREQEIQANYEAMATNTYKTVCKKNIVMMAIKR